MQLGVAGGRAAEVGERGEHPQRLLDRVGDQGRVLEQQLLLLAVFEERAHAAAVGRLGAVVAGGHQQEEAHDDLVFLEFLAVDLGVHEHARQVVGGVLLALGDHLAAALEHLRDVFLEHALDAFGVQVLVGGARASSSSMRAQIPSSSSEMPMKLPITRETIGLRDVADQIAASRGRRAGRAPSTAIA